MLALNPPAILLLTENPDVARRVATALAAVTDRLWFACDDVPGDISVDVVVTDLPSVAQVRRKCPKLSLLAGDEGAMSAAVLGVGTVDGADATLETPLVDESLKLACKLLTQIARLRAEHDMADRAGRRHRELAYTDPLTGVANRRAWDEALAAISSASTPHHGSWCLAIIDLDRFKEVNESSGLTGGDLVLVEAAQALARAVRQNDLVARLGGDEFGVLLSGVSLIEALAVLERVRAAIADAPVATSQPAVTASIGFACPSSAELGGAAVFEAAE